VLTAVNIKGLRPGGLRPKNGYILLNLLKMNARHLH
jgi:hypothetical protein